MKLIGYSSDSVAGQMSAMRPKKERKNTGFCCYCAKELSRHNFTRDHIHPKSLGGRITKPCCKECNSEKKDLTLQEYITVLQEEQKMYEERDLGYRLIGRKITNAIALLDLRADQQ